MGVALVTHHIVNFTKEDKIDVMLLLATEQGDLIAQL